MLNFTISLQNWFNTLSLKSFKTTTALSLKATYPPTAFPDSTFFVTGCWVDYLIAHSRLNLYSFLIWFSFSLFLISTVLRFLCNLALQNNVKRPAIQPFPKLIAHYQSPCTDPIPSKYYIIEVGLPSFCLQMLRECLIFCNKVPVLRLNNYWYFHA